MKFSDKGTLIIPVPSPPIPVFPSLKLGLVDLYGKTEFHITLVGFPMGKQMLEAFEGNPALKPKLEELISKFQFQFIPWEDRLYLMSHPDGRKSIIQIVDCEDIEQLEREWYDLAGLDTDIVPHITLYVNKPSGLGIGINSDREFKEAEARPVFGYTDGLCAYRLDRSLLVMKPVS